MMDSCRPKRQNIPKPLRYQTTSSEEEEREKNVGRKTPMEPNSSLDNDVAELRGVLENDSHDNMHIHSDPLNYTQSTILHDNNTTHSYYTQPSTQTTQTFSPSVTSHAPNYTQLLSVNYTTQTHSNNSSQPINYAPKNYNPAQTITHAPHTHTQHINSGLNTLAYDPKFQSSNIWPNESHHQNFVPPSQTSGEFYNVKPEIQ